MNTQDAADLTVHISKVLFELDPMNTCCNVNEGMEDEYLTEARTIASLLRTGIAVRDAVKLTFDEAYWVGCLEEPTRAQGLDAVVASLASGELTTRSIRAV